MKPDKDEPEKDRRLVFVAVHRPGKDKSMTNYKTKLQLYEVSLILQWDQMRVIFTIIFMLNFLTL